MATIRHIVASQPWLSNSNNFRLDQRSEWTLLIPSKDWKFSFPFWHSHGSPQKVYFCDWSSSFQHAFLTHEVTLSYQLSLQSSLGIIAVKCVWASNSSTIKICRRDLDARLQLPASCCTGSRLSVCYLSSRCCALCCSIWFRLRPSRTL